MKYTLVTLFLLCVISRSAAQRHIVYADVGISQDGAGGSATYNYKLSKRFGVGLGGQIYRFPTPSGIVRNVPAAFADMRIYMRPEKANQFFLFVDLGMHIYDEVDRTYSGTSYADYHNNGLLIGFGFGYLRRITTRGGGPYTSLKVITNNTIIRGYDYPRQREFGVFDANTAFAFSIGFRF